MVCGSVSDESINRVSASAHEANMNVRCTPVAPWPSSLRSRLAVLFALGAGAVVAVTSFVLWRSLVGELNAAVTAGLHQRAADVSAELDLASTVDADVLAHEPFAQIVVGGEVVGRSPALRSRGPVLTPQETAAATARAPQSTLIDRAVPGLGRRSRLLVAPLAAARTPTLIVIGTSLDATVRAQHRLRVFLAVGSPALLGLLAGAGWLLAGAALRPVRRMTEEADTISLDSTGRRLAEPAGDDEIALLGRTLNGMLDRIEVAVAHERRFLDDASHELRTPIAILRGEIELALLDAESEAARTSLTSALEEAERLGHMAEDLLLLARADAGRVTVPAAGPVTVAAVAARTGVTVEGDGQVAVEETVVEQIVANLVGNARRFARDRIVVRVQPAADGYVTVEVSDDGPGFDPDLVDRAFDRFARSGGTGAGLGLAIVAALVRGLDGEVGLRNGPPLGGATVWVTLPAAASG
jgi:signal transduction histidine kinase